MKTPLESCLAISENFTGTVSATPEAIAARDEIVANSAKVTAVIDDNSLAIATRARQDLAAIAKSTEATRKIVKEPFLNFGRTIDETAAWFLDPVNREGVRLKKLSDDYARAKLQKEQEEAARLAKEQRDAQLAAEAAQRELDKAKTAKAKLAAELKLEEAAQNVAAAETQLAAPTVTPRGLSTRVRWDFEITDWRKFIRSFPMQFGWDALKETAKLDRAGLLKSLNSGEHELLPTNGAKSAEHMQHGIKVFEDVSTSTRR